MGNFADWLAGVGGRLCSSSTSCVVSEWSVVAQLAFSPGVGLLESPLPYCIAGILDSLAVSRICSPVVYVCTPLMSIIAGGIVQLTVDLPPQDIKHPPSSSRPRLFTARQI